MELGAQRVGGDKQREWMGQGLAAAAMGAPAMSLAAERRRKNGESRREDGGWSAVQDEEREARWRSCDKGGQHRRATWPAVPEVGRPRHPPAGSISKSEGLKYHLKNATEAPIFSHRIS